MAVVKVSITEEYRNARPAYDRFATRLAELLNDLLVEEGIRIHTIEHRAKTVESFSQKISRPEKEYKDPLRDVSDLAGVRVIAYYISDIPRIAEIIKREFAVDRGRSSDRGSVLRPNEFGYRSHHYVVTLRANRRRLREWRTFSDYGAEIQVRTVVQHAWAAVSHALQYKKEADVPSELSRRLFRVSGLLELADDEFAEISRRSVVIAAQVTASLKVGDLVLPVDRESLEQYAETSKTVTRIVEAARKAGFGREEDVSEPSDPNERYGELAWACMRAGIQTIAELDQICRKQFAHAAGYFRSLRSRSRTQWHGSASWFVELVVILSCLTQFTVESLVAQGWDRDIATRVLSTARESPPNY